MVIRVLISKHFTSEAASEIKKYLSTYEVVQMSSWEPDLEAKALIVRSKDTVNKDLLKNFPNLKIVVSATSGFDHFNFEDLKNSKLKTAYSPNANTVSATELSLFHILNFFKKGPLALSNLERSPSILNSELAGKAVSIVGLGRIGSRLAKILTVLGCEVSAYDPYVSEEAFKNTGAKPVNLDEALITADILSLHCPLTKRTKNMIDQGAFSKMKPSCLLVNCARGGLVDETAAIEAIKENRVGGLCLDVFETEPLPSESQLLNFKNIYTSPHIGGYTAEAQKKSALEAAQQVKNWFEVDEPVLSSVPPNVAWKKDL